MNSKSKQRPKSSILPPLVINKHDGRQRSSSFDYSYIQSQTLEAKKTTESLSGHNSRDELSRSPSANESSAKPLNSSSFLIEQLDDNQRLKTENEILKKNFLKMSRIIQKHSRLLAKKDETIAKLQAKNNYSTNFALSVKPIAFGNQSNPNLQESNRDLIKSLDLRLKNEEFSVKFKQIYDSMIGEFGQHLNQFMAVIEEMQRFFENNLRAIDRKNSLDSQNDKEFEQKSVAFSTEYSALKNSYEILVKQNENFKTIFRILCDSCGLVFRGDLDGSDSVNQLENRLNGILTENKSLNAELATMNFNLQRHEDYCFALVEVISEAELELELLGRNHKTLSDVIDKLERNVKSIHLKFNISYLNSLTKTLSQTYKNQIKSIDSIRKSMKSVQTNTETDEEVSTDWMEPISSPSMMTDTDAKELDPFEMTDFKDAAEDMELFGDETKFGEFDVEAINYILSVKHFNLKTNLEVVEEVDEEYYVEEEEEDDETFDYSQDSVFERSLKENENLDKSGHNDSDLIENEVAFILIEVLDRIERMVSNESDKCLDNIELIENERFVLSRNSIDSTVAKPNVESNVIEIKPQNIDSDFVSEDFCSSPDNNVNVPNNKVELSSSSGSAKQVIMPAIVKYSKNVSQSSAKLTYDIDSRATQMEDHLDQGGNHAVTQLISARNRIKQLEDMLSNEQNQSRGKEQQYLSDELRAWKELVEQQKAIMEKMMNELELQQKINSEKDRIIDSLSRSQSQSSVVSMDNTENDFSTSMDELDLNHLFIGSRDSDDTDIEVIEADDNRVENRKKYDSNQKTSPDIAVQEVWTKHSNGYDRNCVSDVSSLSHTEQSSPLSMPEELLSANRKKVFIPYSHEDYLRHSCHDRLLTYGNHPRKTRLKLKNVDIVFAADRNS